MTNEQIDDKLNMIFKSMNELKVSVSQIEIELKHVIEDKIKCIEKELEHQKTVRSNIYQRIETLENAPAQAALKSKEEKSSMVQKAVIGALVTLLFGIALAFISSQMKIYYSQPQQTTHVKSIDENAVATLPKNPVDDGEYCETDEEKKDIDDE